MISITIYEDDERLVKIGTMKFLKNSQFFKFFLGYFNYNDLKRTTRKKKRFVIIKTK